MKARELMIGDWVELYGTPTRWKLEDYAKWHKEMERTDVHTFEPIPLTPEILEKNGFNKAGEIMPYTYRESKELKSLIQIFTNFGNFDCHIVSKNFDADMRLSYVHELQHALKLCGIDKQIIL